MIKPKTLPVTSQTYILSCRPVGRGPLVEWRISLEEVRTGRRTGFASIEALADFLRQSLQAGDQGKHGGWTET